VYEVAARQRMGFRKKLSQHQLTWMQGIGGGLEAHSGKRG
jgi:hypothetical protein